MKPTLRTICGLVLIATVAACSGGDDDDAGSPAASSTTATEAPPAVDEAALQAIADEVVGEEIRGVVIAVRTPAGEASVAAGATAPESGYRIASNTKTYTAAAVLRLVEDGLVDLDDPLAEHLDPDTVVTLDQDGYDTTAITVRHTLLHGGGFYDYATDPDYEAAVVADPAHRWTRDEQVAFAVEHGDPLFAAGEGFAYSDTGYVLLGELIERTTGLDLAGSFRDLLGFDRLDLDATYLEDVEPAPITAAPRTPQYFGDLDTTALGLNNTFDLWGGGGLVAPMGELARFYEALFGGEVISDESLDTMVTPSPASDDGGAMGIFVSELDGETCFTHTGFWGTVAAACPDSGRTVAVSHGQALTDLDLYEVVADVLAVI